MDGVNRIISFILGLIVVIVFIAVITGKLNLPNRIKTFITRQTIQTPTPTKTPSPTPINKPTQTPAPIKTLLENVKPTGIKKPGVIPETGTPTAIIPLLVATLIGGFFVKSRA